MFGPDPANCQEESLGNCEGLSALRLSCSERSAFFLPSGIQSQGPGASRTHLSAASNFWYTLNQRSGLELLRMLSQKS